MSYDFLNTYTIPVYTGAPPPPPPPLVPAIDQLTDPYHRSNLITIDQTIVGGGYAIPSRYYAPGRPMSIQPRRSVKRAADDAISSHPQSPPSKLATKTQSKEQAAMYTDMVNGYPAELRRLVHAFHCELCDMKMNSLRSASDHYQSKTHDRHINMWLQQNYTDKNLPLPEVRRTLKKSTACNSPTGPDAFHCDLCDLKLTSLTHAHQHFSGRKHKLVASNVSKPSGTGYYNNEGKWVRTGTKVSAAVSTGTTDGRYGIGEAFKVEALATPDTTTPTPTGVTEGVDKAVAVSPVTGASLGDAADSILCSICNVSVTSASQMAMHLEGGRHKKKLRQIALEGQQSPQTPMPTGVDKPQDATVTGISVAAPAVPEAAAGTMSAPSNSLLASLKEKGDTSADLYRTPSGFYYCKACNISMSHESALQQHLLGKKHVKREAEERARAPGTKK